MGAFIPVILPICIGLIFLGIAIALASLEANRYDERQKLVRGNAYAAAFHILLIYTLATHLAEIWLERPWCTPMTNISLSLYLPLGAFLLIAVGKDAYTRPKGSPRRTGVALLIAGGIMLAYAVFEWKRRGILTPEGLVDLPLHFLAGPVFLLSGLLQLWRCRRAAKEDQK